MEPHTHLQMLLLSDQDLNYEEPKIGKLKLKDY